MGVAQVISQNLIGEFRSSSWFAWLCGSLLGKIPTSYAFLPSTYKTKILPCRPYTSPWACASSMAGACTEPLPTLESPWHTGRWVWQSLAHPLVREPGISGTTMGSSGKEWADWGWRYTQSMGRSTLGQAVDSKTWMIPGSLGVLDSDKQPQWILL